MFSKSADQINAMDIYETCQKDQQSGFSSRGKNNNAMEALSLVRARSGLTAVLGHSLGFFHPCTHWMTLPNEAFWWLGVLGKIPNHFLLQHLQIKEVSCPFATKGRRGLVGFKLFQPLSRKAAKIMLQITAAPWLLLLAAYEVLRKSQNKQTKTKQITQTTQTREQNHLQF